MEPHGGIATRDEPVVLIGVQQHPHDHLVKVADASGLLRRCLGLAQHWQQHRRQYGDNRDYDQKLNQSKPPSPKAFRLIHLNE
jgi:hypothetical protein